MGRVETGILVRYWAGAKAAAGVAEERFEGPATVAELRERAVERHDGGGGLDLVLRACSVLVDGQRASGDVAVPEGGVVEFLPPFAGG